MRVRNVKNKKEILDNCFYVLKDYQNYRGRFSEIFKNDNKIDVEIGTGKCDFIINMAKKYPNRNFIGIEKNDSVLSLGVKKIDTDIPNLRLICAGAEEIDEIFLNEVDTLYLNFSDPWPKKRHEKRRLTSSYFLNKYDKIFCFDAKIIQKTDNKDLFAYSIVSLSNNGYVFDLVNLRLQNEENDDNIMTEYEVKFTRKGIDICKLEARKKLK